VGEGRDRVKERVKFPGEDQDLKEHETSRINLLNNPKEGEGKSVGLEGGIKQ